MLFWLAGGWLVAAAIRAEAVPLWLERGALDPASAESQAQFLLFKSSASAPVAQRLSATGTAPWLVQFTGAIREDRKAALEKTGAAIRGYIPENGFLVEANPRQISQIAAGADVAWVGEYLPAYKQAKAVREWRPANPDETREFRVQLLGMEGKFRVVRELGEMNAPVSREEARSASTSFRTWLAPQQVAEVANWGEVEWIEFRQPARSWGTSFSGAEAAGAPDDMEAALRQAFAAGERVRAEIRGIADAGGYGADARAVDRFVWEHPDMLVVAAAGNAAVDLNPADGVADAGSVGSPATAKNALAVGAAEGRGAATRVWRDSWPEDFAVQPIALDPMAQADGPQGLAAFSGRGPCADGRIKPELVAPGTFVAVPRSSSAADTGWGVAADTNFMYAGGTGVAAEQVADAAKQARQWLMEQRGLPAPSAALVKALLINGARDLAPGQYGAGAKQEIPFARPNAAQGFGLLDLARALRTGAGEVLELRDARGLAADAADTVEMNTESAGGRFVLTLAYSDCAAAPGAGRQRVNDLDLTVQTPSGKVLHANGRSSPDAENNVEQIEFEADEVGAYVARVAARAVPMGGSQPYALVVRKPGTETASAATAEQP